MKSKLSVLILFLFLIVFSACNSAENKQDNIIRNKNKVHVEVGDNYQVEAEIAKTMLERAAGLSHRESLATDEAMLFIFDKPDYYQFWMKDMKFPIDIIFINEDKIVDIKKSVPPALDDGNIEHYPPVNPAIYVLETPAGISEEYGFEVGTPVEMELTYN
ncbi:DUF192 domain-containing protein [Patescibacteria group bacterium]|nr:DUF192 domain-containing protein [Patescibacteria group bacterium]MBU1673668.1 DUF192 domain-containing protein [Patescibacteria group bacterium]MBU1963844.1 DUF192 domain-containing protein [Patescibacteria group bacterium]